LRQSHKTVLLWIILILMFVSIYHLFTNPGKGEDKQDFGQFVEEIKNPEKRAQIDKITIQPRGNNSAKYVIMYKNSQKKTVTQGEYFDSTTELFRHNQVNYSVDLKEESTFWASILIQWLPMLFLFVIFIFFMRQLQAGGGKAMSFGKSKAKLLTDHQNKVTFKDVAGIEEAKDEVEEIIAFLKDPKKFTRLGGRIPKGVLMMGPPGTGKTLLARAIAGEAGVPFFSISGSDFVEMFVGVGASRVRDLFEQGKKNAPCIIFIDEIDAVGRHRGAGLGGGHDEREQTLNQLLVEMDGFESNDGVILIAATNRPDVLDPALLRPGRFDRRIVVPRPDVKGRLGILQVHTRKVPLALGVDLDVIARGTPGFSGADLENLVNEAALWAARKDKDKVEMADFEAAKDKVLMGTERRSMIISDKEKRITAYHEGGHALVARMLPGADPVHKVTIIPRGRALGVTQQLPSEDRLNMTREFARNQISILMGGRSAEELTFGEITTGAGNDIEVATDLARKMVCEWGMSEKLGPLTFGKKEEAIFLGREFAQHQDYSEETAVEIDQEVRKLVMDNYARAKKVIGENLDKLKAIAEALLEFETLSTEDINLLMNGEKIERKPPSPPPVVKKDDARDRDREKKGFFPRPLGKEEPEPA
jgi:cell division protease FtsH